MSSDVSGVRDDQEKASTDRLFAAAAVLFVVFGFIKDSLMEGFVFFLAATVAWAWGKARRHSLGRTRRIWCLVSAFAFLVLLTTAALISYFQFWR